MSKEIDFLEKLIKSGAKIYSLEHQGDHSYVSIIRGVDGTISPPEVLVTKYKVKKSTQLDNFIANDFVQHAFFKPTNRGVILVDIVGYSKGNTLLQSAFLVAFQNALHEIISVQEIYTKGNFIEQIIPTGDGCYLVFHESLNDRFLKAAFGILSSMHVTQNRLLKEMGKDFKNDKERITLRVGCELGETDFFYDLSGNRNCFGVGMNEAARILSCGHKNVETSFPDKSNDNTLFIGENVINQAKLLFDWLKQISPGTDLKELGSLTDKHGMSRNVYWMYGFSKYMAVNLFSPEELYK